MKDNEGFISYDMKIPEQYDLVEIKTVTHIGKKHTWDIEVPIVHAFTAKHKSGLESVSHNSAMISLFSHDDEELLLCKSNFPINLIDHRSIGNNNFEISFEYQNRIETLEVSGWDLNNIKETGCIPWYKLEEQRGRANNSVMLLRSETSEEYFKQLMKKVENSKAGEPGVYWTNDLEMGTNPCAEISLDLNGGFCNLTEVNVSNLESMDDLIQRVKDATFIGTLQASYTDFHYLGHQWKEIAERDSLLGVSMTGIGSGDVLKYDLSIVSEEAKSENKRVADLIGIKSAKRLGTLKPSGTAALVLGTSSGIHAWYNDYYLRRMRINKDEAIYKYLSMILGEEFIQDDCFNPHRTAVLSIPIKAPDGSILRTETPIELLDRVKKFQIEWIRGTHVSGKNTHNVSVTVSIKPEEWDQVSAWMWENKDFYNGISVLDYDGGTYPQMPFADIAKEEYERLNTLLNELISKYFDIKDIVEEDDIVDHKGESSCAGGNCEVSSL